MADVCQGIDMTDMFHWTVKAAGQQLDGQVVMGEVDNKNKGSKCFGKLSVN